MRITLKNCLKIGKEQNDECYMMNKSVSLTLALCTALSLSACNPSSEPKPDVTVPNSNQTEVVDHLKTPELKAFKATADDVHDIQQLEKYQLDFAKVSEAMETELLKLKKAGTLTTEFDHQRKRDNIESALTLLKALDLKTEQGRYIQGLMYRYWENQANVFDEQKASATGELKNPSDAIKGIGEFIHAEDQLTHWKHATPSAK